MRVHKFQVGQRALLERNVLTQAKAEMVEILRQLPSDVGGTPQYHVKANHEIFDRLAREDQLSPVFPLSASPPTPLVAA